MLERSLVFLFSASLCAATGQAAPSGLLFRASFDKTLAAEFAAGDPEPLTAIGVGLDEVAGFRPNSSLTWDARGNLYAEQGTVSFWWRPDEPPGRLRFPIFLVSYEQHSTWDFNFARIEWTGSELAARVNDRNLEYHSVSAPFRPQVGRWVHIVLSWNERDGLRFYLDGRLAGAAAGPMALDARLDQFGFMSNAVTPHHTAGTENSASIDEVRIYSAAVSDAGVAALKQRREPSSPSRVQPDLQARFGWNENAGIPKGSAFTVRRIPVLKARDLGKFWFKGVDGKRETTWPMVGHGYMDEGKVYRVQPEAQPFNLIRTTGNLDADIAARDIRFSRSGDTELHYRRLPSPVMAETLTVERRRGVLADLEFLLVEPGRASSEPGWVRFNPGGGDSYRDRRDPESYTAWKPGPNSGTSAKPYNYFAIPAETDTPADAIQVRLPAVRGAYYHLAIEDPVNTSRHLIEFDVQADTGRLDLTLDFPDIIVPSERQLTLIIASSAPALSGVEARIVRAGEDVAHAAHMAARVAQIRDSFQMLSEARPWMRLGRGLTLPQLRRQLKLVDELYTLMEDARRVEPNHPVVSGYWSWVNRLEPPPPFQEPRWDDPAAPAWASRQLSLLKYFRQVVDWWIENRQIETGEMGGGLGDDTDMIQNWPAVGLLDGPAEKIRDSVRRVVEACYAQRLIDKGMNSNRTDALHAYEEGMNAFGPAFLLDYGNPVLFERMMETASHYARLTGVNDAGHRHFRSHRYSSTDLVEEGYHAREDSYSHLILHPGLYVAWYNGLPAVTNLLREFGASLLAHWQKERYPQLAKTIFFADDRVAGRSTPNSETFNLLSGLADITGDPRFLWLQREAIEHGDIYSASASNGLWLDVLPDPIVREALLGQVHRRNIHNHNLQTDQTGLVARTLLWQLTGEIDWLEDAHRALLRHMAQNIYLYTEAEQFTDRIWIPTLSVQRERLGGVAHYRNHIYPGHAVSWENAGGEVAALVPEARSDYLRLILYHSGGKPRRVTARTWRLENGAYEISARTKDGVKLWARSARLKRFAPVHLDLRPAETVIIEIRQTEKGVPLAQLPDLAIAAEEFQDAGGLEIPVHNIGAVSSRPFTVSVTDRQGNLLAAERRPALPAPTDLHPRVVRVHFNGVRQQPGLTVRVTQEGGGEEICDENNLATTR